jgi:formate--tetrahydrofolate ligase
MEELSMVSDLEIAQSAKLKPICEIAEALGLHDDEFDLYGRYKAKVLPDAVERLSSRPNGKYIDVTAITPTPLGEGKTVTTIGLAQGLWKIGKRAIATLRQPSMGPVFGIKGGAAGGGYAQVVPMEDLNLHFTGDFHAVTAAHNLLAAMLDAHIFHGNGLDIDPLSILWPRVLDILDRSLRSAHVEFDTKTERVAYDAHFDITAASEVMAILALSNDLHDLRQRLGRIVVAVNRRGQAVTAEDLKAAGAMAVLLKDAVRPNLIQTLENTPAFVHAGPFGNIAHGNNSIIADRLALKLGDYVVTESGFGADLGFEKFCHIKCRAAGFRPNAAVIVCTIRALKAHSGKFRIIPGKPLDPDLLKEDGRAVEVGAANLVKQIENVRRFGVPAVVAINRFTHDTPSEIALVRAIARDAGAFDVAVSDVWVRGGEGGVELAEAVVRAAESPNDFHYLYPLEAPIREKITTIAREIYGASEVSYEPLAEWKERLYVLLGFDRLPICMSKTQYSLSHDPKLKGRPTGFTFPVLDIRASVGAGYIYPLCGEINTMPGLPSVPAATKIDIDKNGRVKGLF